MRKIFRIFLAIILWPIMQGPLTIAFTLFGLIPFVGIIVFISQSIMYLSTGSREKWIDAVEGAEMALVSLFGGTLCCYSFIQTGSFDTENYGTKHLQKRDGL